MEINLNNTQKHEQKGLNLVLHAITIKMILRTLKTDLKRWRYAKNSFDGSYLREKLSKGLIGKKPEAET